MIGNFRVLIIVYCPLQQIIYFTRNISTFEIFQFLMTLTKLRKYNFVNEFQAASIATSTEVTWLTKKRAGS
jgi:hypothetical protein